MQTRNLATCDFQLLRGMYFNEDIDGASFRFEGRKFEIQINVQPHCWPDFEVTIGPMDFRKKHRQTVLSRFVIQACEWNRETIATALMFNHYDELKKHGITYKIDTDTIELPPEI